MRSAARRKRGRQPRGFRVPADGISDSPILDAIPPVKPQGRPTVSRSLSGSDTSARTENTDHKKTALIAGVSESVSDTKEVALQQELVTPLPKANGKQQPSINIFWPEPDSDDENKGLEDAVAAAAARLKAAGLEEARRSILEQDRHHQQEKLQRELEKKRYREKAKERARERRKLKEQKRKRIEAEKVTKKSNIAKTAKEASRFEPVHFGDYDSDSDNDVKSTTINRGSGPFYGGSQRSGQRKEIPEYDEDDMTIMQTAGTGILSCWSGIVHSFCGTSSSWRSVSLMSSEYEEISSTSRYH